MRELAATCVDRGAGYAIRLDMAGLPPAAEGEFYEGWLRADDGEMVSVGTFHMRSGDSDVVLWSGVRIAEYHTLIVTEEDGTFRRRGIRSCIGGPSCCGIATTCRLRTVRPRDAVD